MPVATMWPPSIGLSGSRLIEAEDGAGPPHRQRESAPPARRRRTRASRRGRSGPPCRGRSAIAGPANGDGHALAPSERSPRSVRRPADEEARARSSDSAPKRRAASAWPSSCTRVKRRDGGDEAEREGRVLAGSARPAAADRAGIRARSLIGKPEDGEGPDASLIEPDRMADAPGAPMAATRLERVPYVYAFDHKHRRRADGHEGPARRQGRQPRRDDDRARPARAARASPSPPTPAAPTWPAAGPTGLDDEIAKHVVRLEKKMGRKLGDPSDPLLVSVRSGAKFSMPGMMDTVLNLGPQRPQREGPGHGHQRRALRLRLLPPLHLDVRPHRARRRRRRLRRAVREGQGHGRRRPATPRSRPTPSPSCATSYKARRQASTPASPSRRTRGRSCAGAIEAVFRSLERRPGHRLPGARAHQPRPRHRGERAGDGVRQPRRQLRHRRRLHPQRRHRREQALRRLPRQRPGRGRRGRHPQHRGPRRPRPTTSPTIHDELLDIFDRLEAHYRDMCDTEFTIEQGKLWMLQTRVGKRTGAAALRMAVDMTKRPQASADHRGRGRAADHRRPPRPGAAPAVRRHGPAGRSPRASAASPGAAVGQGRTSPPTTPPTPPSAARTSSSCAPRPPPRTCTA